MGRSHLLPDAGEVLDLHQAVYCAVRDYRGGLTAVAAVMATNYGTLQKKLSIVNDTHHVSLADFEQIVSIVDDPRIDSAYARLRGKMLYQPAQVDATHDALKSLSEVLGAAAKFVESLQHGAADKLWDLHEVAELEHFGNELIGKILGIVAGAHEEMEAGNG